jgi:tetratricopeptide (TPR) repeat protein
MSGGFVQDDHPIVERNPVVHRGGLAEIFGTDYWGGVAGGDASLYRPVTILTFALERGPDGAVDPRGAHRVNVALHALASLALLLLARRFGASWPVAGAAGLLFAAHPVHSAAVSGLVGRADVLAALFTLAALLAQSAAGRAAPWLAGFLVFLALGSKETAIAAPVLLAALEILWKPPEPGRFAAWLRERSFALAPAALGTLAFLAFRARAIGSFLALQRPMLSDNPLVALHGTERAGTALGLAARAMGLMIAPIRLTPDYSGTVIRTEPGLAASLPLAGLLVLVILAALACLPFLSWRRAPEQAADPMRRIAFAALLFLLPYLVIGNLLVPIGVIFAERLLYLPSAGFCLLVPCLAEAALALRRPPARLTRPFISAIAAVLATLLLAAGLRTSRAASEWTSDERLWEAAALSTPTSPRAQFTLGKIRADQGRDAEALDRFERATVLWPFFSSAWYEQGLLLARRGDLTRAEEAFRKASQQNPRNEGAATQLGVVLGRLGRLDEAVGSLSAAAERFPRSANFAEALGDALFAAGRFSEAAEAYRRGAALGRPDLAERVRLAKAAASGVRLRTLE